MKTKLRMVKTMIIAGLMTTMIVAVSCAKKEDFTAQSAKEIVDAEKNSSVVVNQTPNDPSKEALGPLILVTAINTTGLANPVGCLKEVKVILNSVTCSYFTANGNVLYYNWSHTANGPFYSSTSSNSCSPKFWLGPGTTYLKVSTMPNGGGSTSPWYSKLLGTCIGPDID